MVKESRKQNINKNIEFYYTDGNTVRKIATPVTVPEAPSIREDREEQRREHRRSYRRSENVEMSLPYVAFLFAMVIMIVVACVEYLDLNSKISEANKDISNLQTQLDTLITKNDAMDYEINGFIDVDYILETAKTQLGMVVAGKEQVRFYDSSVSEYMNQLNDVE